MTVDVTAVRRLVDAARRAKRTPNRLRGGKADGVHPRFFRADALTKGIIHELEHTRSIELAMEIAMDHLFEDTLYYTKLERMERAGRRPQRRSSLARLLNPNSAAWGSR